MNACSETERRILLVEDDATCRRLVGLMLRPEAYEIHEAATGHEAVEIAGRIEPELILMDLNLPGWDGYETLRRLKEDPRTSRIPVMVLTAEDRTWRKAMALDMGAVDVLCRPIDPVELRARVRAALRSKHAQDLLERRAHIDALTGLGNRHALEERLAADWGRCRHRGASLAVLMADLDRFKLVNDRLGHVAGDAILRGAADALRNAVRGGDFVARFGGEEFVVIATECDFPGAVAIAERFRRTLAAMREPHNPEGLHLSASVGISAVEDIAASAPEDLIGQADAALYRAKQAGRDAVWVLDGGRFRPADGSRLEDDMVFGLAGR